MSPAGASAGHPFRPTLNVIFVATLCGLTLLLAALFYLFFKGSRESIIESAKRLRDNAGAQIAGRSEQFFARAQDSVSNIARQVKLRTFTIKEPLDIEPALYAELLANPDIYDIAFTFGKKTGSGKNGAALIDPHGRGEIDVMRVGASTTKRIHTRYVHQNGDAFVSDLRQRAENGDFGSTPFVPETGRNTGDPTSERTFTTAASDDFFQQPIWSDLHPIPGSDPKAPDVFVTIQQSIADANGNFLGVIRASLSLDELKRIVSGGLNGNGQPDPHRIFLCDNEGDLVVPVAPGDTLAEFPSKYRFKSTSPPPEIAAALKLGQLAKVDSQNMTATGEFEIDGERYLVSFRALNKTQDWIVGIVAPEKYYLSGLLEARLQILKYALAVMLVILLGGIFTIRIVKHDLATIVNETGRMRNFEFSAMRAEPRIEDVHVVMDRLEQAKTAMRSMSKYVPIALVRQLYEMRAEPVLGSELVEISMMFSDVKDFTTLSEKLSPDDLAHALGRYLQLMTNAIQAQHGTVDKFIGDAVMTLWNVPLPLDNHAQLACRSALDCQRLLTALFASPEWKGLPPFETRFGLHKDRVMVGHFGAPDRMNYTAMGDGVNLASRLEGLNKVYGTTILVSDVIEAECRAHFAFRLIDIVAVKGKSKGLKVYELLGTSGETVLPAQTLANYEKAFELYQNRDFNAALALLEAQLTDAPSAVLAERCRQMHVNPPSREWTGIYYAKSK